MKLSDAIAVIDAWASRAATEYADEDHDDPDLQQMILAADSFCLAARRCRYEEIESCEHGIPEGEYCQPCNAEYKRAAREDGCGD